MVTVKEQVITARQNGATYSQIKTQFGVAKSTAQEWVAKGWTPTPERKPQVGYVNEDIQRDKPVRFKKTEDEVLQFLSELAPIKTTRDRAPTTSHLSEFAVVGSDFHFGCHDESAINIFLEVIDELKPKTIVLNGDTMDFLAVSKYSKDLKHNWSLLTERMAYHSFLESLIEVSDGAEIFETFSNHSGSSVDGRWRRYLSDRIGELSSLPNITDILSYENVFMGEFQDDVQHVDFVELSGLVVTHGTSVRGDGGASCLAEINKWKTSILHGHTHRIGSSAQRIPAFGKRKESQIYGFEGGCLCKLDSTYSKHPNWSQGFNIVGLHGDTFSMEQVLVQSGVANVSTLGKTIYSN